jgi:hypothetical protein
MECLTLRPPHIRYGWIRANIRASFAPQVHLPQILDTFATIICNPLVKQIKFWAIGGGCGLHTDSLHFRGKSFHSIVNGEMRV